MGRDTDFPDYSDVGEDEHSIRGRRYAPMLTQSTIQKFQVGLQEETWTTCVINPEDNSPFTQFWTLLRFVTLFVTAYMEPFVLAVGITSLGIHLATVFLDVFFFADLVMQFFFAYPLSSDHMGENMLERDRRKIALRYCGSPFSRDGRGMFWWDILAILPGGMQLFHLGHFDGAHISESLVLFRLLRLTRLKRMHVVATYLPRIHELYGLPFYLVDFVKFFIVTTIACHWLACIWIMIDGRVTQGLIRIDTTEESWLSMLIAAKGDPCLSEMSEDWFTHSGHCYYTLALYWAITTLTTVGYGDITPQNMLEYIVCLVCMLFCGYLWAWIVGGVINIVSSMGARDQEHRRATDDLLDLMSRRHVPMKLQYDLLRFLRRSKDHKLKIEESAVMRDRISIGLQREVARLTPEYNTLQQQVFWTEGLDNMLYLDILRNMSPKFYGPREALPILGRLVSIRKGRVMKNLNFVGRGEILGASDVILESVQLMETSMPWALTYVDALCLERQALRDVCRDYPESDFRLRRAQVRTAVWRAFVKAARDELIIRNHVSRINSRRNHDHVSARNSNKQSLWNYYDAVIEKHRERSAMIQVSTKPSRALASLNAASASQKRPDKVIAARVSSVASGLLGRSKFSSLLEAQGAPAQGGPPSRVPSVESPASNPVTPSSPAVAPAERAERRPRTFSGGTSEQPEQQRAEQQSLTFSKGTSELPEQQRAERRLLTFSKGTSEPPEQQRATDAAVEALALRQEKLETKVDHVLSMLALQGSDLKRLLHSQNLEVHGKPGHTLASFSM